MMRMSGSLLVIFFLPLLVCCQHNTYDNLANDSSVSVYLVGDSHDIKRNGIIAGTGLQMLDTNNWKNKIDVLWYEILVKRNNKERHKFTIDGGLFSEAFRQYLTEDAIMGDSISFLNIIGKGADGKLVKRDFYKGIFKPRFSNCDLIENALSNELFKNTFDNCDNEKPLVIYDSISFTFGCEKMNVCDRQILVTYTKPSSKDFNQSIELYDLRMMKEYEYLLYFRKSNMKSHIMLAFRVGRNNDVFLIDQQVGPFND